MLSPEQNERLTRVSPGTPTGNLMRRYWHLVAATAQLEDHPVREVKLLGESLVLYRDLRGRLGLLAEACPHRGTSLASGTTENEGLRCSLHGWLYDAAGICLDQPLEPPADTAEPQVATVAYPVQALAGLIFAYLGPKPVPLLPRYNVLAWKGVARETDGMLIPCNWLQVMENLMDPMHVECLHRQYFAYVLERQGGPRLEEFLAHYAPVPMKRIGFDFFEDGIIERHVTSSEGDYSWRIGTPTFFPTTSLMGSSRTRGSLIFVVPVDDTHTWFVEHAANRPGMVTPPLQTNRFYEVSGVAPDGQFITDTANGQDYMATVTQGDLAPREDERLATSDLGIVLYRQMLMNQIEEVERGHDPINVHRDATKNRIIEVPSPDRFTAHSLATQSARQRKRARHRERDILRQASSNGDGATTVVDQLGAGTRNSPSAAATGHYEVVIRPSSPTG